MRIPFVGFLLNLFGYHGKKGKSGHSRSGLANGQSEKYRLKVEKIQPHLCGWCVDQTNINSIFLLKVYVDEKPCGTVINNAWRPDLANSQISCGYGGFKLLNGLANLAPGSHVLKFGYPDGKFSKDFKFQTHPHQYEAAIELIGPDLAGWAIDRNHPHAIFDLCIIVDGESFATVKNDQPLLPASKNMAGLPQRGFYLADFFQSLPEGRHKIHFLFPDGNVTKARAFEVIPPKYGFHIDSFQPALSGWCIELEDPDALFVFDIYLDNIFYLASANDREREDSAKYATMGRRGGFSIFSPCDLLAYGEHEIKARYPDGGFSRSFPFTSRKLSTPILKNLSLLASEVSIIIPVGKSAAQLEACLAACLADTSQNIKFILVADETQSGEIRQALGALADREDLQIVENGQNSGFAAKINLGLENSGSNDVVVLDPGARVTPGWLKSLKFCAYSMPKVATVTPIADNCGIFSAPRPDGNNQLPLCASPDEYGMAVRHASLGYYPANSPGGSFCIYIKHGALQSLGMLDASLETGQTAVTDFCLRADRAGWQNLCDPATYVFCGANPEVCKAGETERIIKARYPAYPEIVRAFAEKMAPARYATALAAANWHKLARPGLLFVSGGAEENMPRAGLNLISEIAQSARCYIMRVDNAAMRLHTLRDGELELLLKHRLDAESGSASHAGAEYETVAAAWLFKLDIKLVHIGAFVPYNHYLIDAAKKLGCKVVFSFPAGFGASWNHDHGINAILENISKCDLFIVPSGDARASIAQHLPAIPQENFLIIPEAEKSRSAQNSQEAGEAGSGRGNSWRLISARCLRAYGGMLQASEYSGADRPGIAVCTYDDRGSSFVRLLEPCQNGFDRPVTYLVMTPHELLASARAGLIRGAIIQRDIIPALMVEELLFELGKHGIPYILEMDDDLFNVPADKDTNGVYKKYEPFLRLLANRAAALRVSTSQLRERLSSYCDRIIVYENRLSQRLWLPPPYERDNDGLVRAIYFGSGTHMRDLELILPALGHLAAEHPDFRLMVNDIGARLDTLLNQHEFMEYHPIPQEMRVHPNFVAYMRGLVAKADFGIAPLEDTYFNCGKSSMKILEMGALGLPCVASNVGPYKSMEGVPHIILCKNEVDAWILGLEKKMALAVKNRQQGLETRKYVLENHSFSKKALMEFDRQILNILIQGDQA